jgi:hypothetical protein
LRLANLPNFALDRLSRYEATLWRQAGRLPSMPWIAASHKKEGAAPLSMIGENCRPPKVTIMEFGTSSGFRRVGGSDHDAIGPRSWAALLRMRAGCGSLAHGIAVHFERRAAAAEIDAVAEEILAAVSSAPAKPDA